LRLGGALAAASFFAPVLGACGGGGGGNGNVELRFAAFGDQVDLDVKDRQIRMFQQENENVRIKTEYTGIEDYFDKLATQASGGNAPDVFMITFGALPEYAQRGVLLDFGELGSGVVDTSNFEEGLLESATRDGSLYALPLGFTAQPALVYDATALEEAGVEPPGQDLTLDGFRDLTQRIAEATGEGSYGTSDSSGDLFALEGFVRGRGKELYSREGQLGFDKEDLAAWFTYWEELRQSGAAPPADVQAEAVNIDFANSLLIRGKAPLLFTPASNALRRVQSVTENEMGLALYPKASEGARSGQVAAPIDFLTASARSDNREEAARFISFCLNDPEAAPLLGMSYGIPPNRQVADKISSELEGVSRKNYDYVQLVSEVATPRIPFPPGANEIGGDLLVRISQDVAFGRSSVDKGVDNFFSEAERILSS